MIKHEIKLTDDTPFKEPYRRIPPALYEKVRIHLKELLGWCHQTISEPLLFKCRFGTKKRG